MKISHVIDTLSVDSGGPARSVPLLCRELSKNATVNLFALKSDNDVAPPPGVDVYSYSKNVSWTPIGNSKGLKDRLYSDDADIFDCHGLWQMSTHYAVHAAIKNRKPVIVTPRGMLEPEALNISAWKKKLAWLLWQRRDLEIASCIHVTSEMEANNCRALGLTNPIAVVPNGIDVSEYPLKDVSEVEASQTIGSSGVKVKRQVLFLSRIHPKKGLKFLLEAWAQLAVYHSEWQLIIAGNDENNHENNLQNYASTLGLNWSKEFDQSSSLCFVGPLFNDEKLKAYQRAEIFVLPTLSENFGMVIAEALSCGTPVITTKGTPWEILEESNSGWWINVGSSALTQVLHDALSKESSELYQMGLNGRRVVTEQFSIESVAKKMEAVYQWCVHGGTAPDTVNFLSSDN
ncbi:glycosyltransferase [Vibrio sp. 10N.261.51.C6]|uniref:glycosyltransferase n=1 Tax=Vibrio sp. 10N.261.51.C6 TaxID=3229676 RepID=UPI00354EF28A